MYEYLRKYVANTVTNAAEVAKLGLPVHAEEI